MLIDLKEHISDFEDRDPLTALIANVNNRGSSVKEIIPGVYEIGHFNFNRFLEQKGLCIHNTFDLERIPYKDPITEADDMQRSPYNFGFSEYGVCDSYQQILDQADIEESGRLFVISITPIIKEDQPEQGGWRWHKWGPYIGTHEPQCEYLHDEPEIEKVYVYHIYELLDTDK